MLNASSASWNIRIVLLRGFKIFIVLAYFLFAGPLLHFTTHCLVRGELVCHQACKFDLKCGEKIGLQCSKKQILTRSITTNKQTIKIIRNKKIRFKIIIIIFYVVPLCISKYQKRHTIRWMTSRPQYEHSYYQGVQTECFQQLLCPR